MIRFIPVVMPTHGLASPFLHVWVMEPFMVLLQSPVAQSWNLHKRRDTLVSMPNVSFGMRRNRR
jgi:hypothetical protein